MEGDSPSGKGLLFSVPIGRRVARMRGSMLGASPRVIAVVISLLTAGVVSAETSRKPAKVHQLDITQATEDKFMGDFDQILERRRIRVLVPYSRTLFFNDKGTPRGITADLMREFEEHLNRKYRKQLKKRPLTLYIIPTTRDELIDDVAQGFRRHRGREPVRNGTAIEGGRFRIPAEAAWRQPGDRDGPALTAARDHR